MLDEAPSPRASHVSPFVYHSRIRARTFCGIGCPRPYRRVVSGLVPGDNRVPTYSPYMPSFSHLFRLLARGKESGPREARPCYISVR